LSAEAAADGGHAVGYCHIVEAEQLSPAPERGSGQPIPAKIGDNDRSAGEPITGPKEIHDRPAGEMVRHLTDEDHIHALV
jgi:hypothetical protein